MEPRKRRRPTVTSETFREKHVKEQADKTYIKAQMASISVAYTAMVAAAPAAAVHSSSLLAPSKFRSSARPSLVAPVRKTRLTVYAGKDGGREKQPGERLSELKQSAQDIVDNVSDAVKNVASGDKTPSGEFKGRVTGKGGSVREVTNANKSGGAQEKVGSVLEDIKDSVDETVANVKNAIGGNEGISSSTQKGAFTTPNRERMKANLDPSKHDPWNKQ